MADNQITPFQLTDQFTMDNFNQRINETNTALQNKLGGIESTDYPGCYYRMVDGVVEWFNPPMQLGAEYRTTERHQGKPVYVKLVDFGTFPNKTFKEVEHGCTNVGVMISCIGYLGNATANNYPGVSAVFANPTYIRADTDSDFSAFTGQFILKYTKTTD